MKRTVPLLITAVVGTVLIASRFIPAAESWGESAAIWFDILAAVAFVLGGGNLVKLQLRKISDRVPGWGYAAITLIAFFAMLSSGLGKVGSQPAVQQEFYGQSFAPLAVADLPPSTTAKVPGTLPKRPDGAQPPLSVKRQLSEENGQLVFRGWMTSRQQAELSEFKDSLPWQCTVQKLYEASQPKPALKGKIEYLADHSSLAARGFVSDELRDALKALGGDEQWNKAVDTLYAAGQRKTTVPAPQLPAGFQIPASMQSSLTYETAAHELVLRGPMSVAVRDKLARANFPQVHPLSAEARTKFRSQLEALSSPLNAEQTAALESALSKSWVLDKLKIALDEAGKAVAAEPTPCEMAQAQEKAGDNAAAASDITKAQKSGPDQMLNVEQQTDLDHFAGTPSETVDQLAELLRKDGPFNDRQADALSAFFDKIPTTAEQKLDLAMSLLRAGPLSRAQFSFLVDDYRTEHHWQNIVGELFVKAHVTKYPWSGTYNTSASAFGWQYEFMFKPLQATMFSLLCFYVASAAYRAFRAKNLEAILLLVTASIILLGQTIAGNWLTGWIPDTSPLAPFKIKNLMEYVAVFLTAGSRAIMIGIALGVASTSLRVLLGIDRSHLGTGD
jgi:hypothetical protein